MGETYSRADHITANVINTIKIIDHEDDIQDINQNRKIVIAIFVFVTILKVVKIYKRSVQGRRDQKHALGQV